MTASRNAWAIRPHPHGKYRMQEFTANGMAAIGWPQTGDLSGCDREQIRKVLRGRYYVEASEQSLGQATGIVDRFINQVKTGDAIIVPDGSVVYFGEVSAPYSWHPDLADEENGYPHWLGVTYCFDKRPLARGELPATLYDALKGRQTVFSVPCGCVEEVLQKPGDYLAFDQFTDQDALPEYIERLSQGLVPGINSTRFEDAVQKVLSLYFPGLRRLATTNAPVGADTDLATTLPGQLNIRIQVKCFQDKAGPLDSWVVTQLRDSMELGDHGIIVTTNRVSDAACIAARAESEKPVGIIDGTEFAQLVFENIDRLTEEVLWSLGLRRSTNLRG